MTPNLTGKLAWYCVQGRFHIAVVRAHNFSEARQIAIDNSLVIGEEIQDLKLEFIADNLPDFFHILRHY